MLKEVEKEYPGLQSGWAYDDGMASSLKDASEQWFQEQDSNDDGDLRHLNQLSTEKDSSGG